LVSAIRTAGQAVESRLLEALKTAIQEGLDHPSPSPEFAEVREVA
jgi:hypothetical protein